MKAVLGLTGAFVLVTALFSKTGFPDSGDYELLTQRPEASTKVTYDRLATGLKPGGCAEAFARRDRGLYPGDTALCVRRGKPREGIKICETQNARGQTLYEETPFFAPGGTMPGS